MVGGVSQESIIPKSRAVCICYFCTRPHKLYIRVQGGQEAGNEITRCGQN